MSCPICKKPSDKAYRPFCSRRCADVDLGRWLTGGYAIPAVSDEDEDPEDQGPDAPRRLN
ncbi:DNA gyrase inhibitor YacG [Alphaproteobacteria bacterium GH1-50]|uniref:DNA gyrase inhibitor YacG n=1 Tax=Kangsaoukella pontilimi TaxID=2691042 RepID=A0A7C9IQR1_9RHOB|nr:DNA gyrase inhibitor YacG [Kangsaoukella pontilimi]MXQ08023.1 DNA gyrase inhibitor YacG [Kangsaoukella pontilimi]